MIIKDYVRPYTPQSDIQESLDYYEDLLNNPRLSDDERRATEEHCYYLLSFLIKEW